MFPSLLPNYARADIAFVRGEGPYLYTETGQRYLDFGSGVAVNALGHANPVLTKALSDQAQKLWHVSNYYRVPGQEELSRKLVDASFADTVFFANSGAEAVECAIKMARRYHFVSDHPEKFRIITFEGAFHGRTLATIAAGGQAKYLEGFGPKVEGFDQVPFQDGKALEAAITHETAALMIEPIQGEGGLRPVPPDFLRLLRKLCDDHGLLLIFDEIQTGVGRTGKFFAHEYSGVLPDIMAVAKGIGGGFPLGACLATADAAKGMGHGTHGSTFGGNPLGMAVGNALVDIILAPGFLDQVRNLSSQLRQQLARLLQEHPKIFEDIRGAGLMMGMKLRISNADFITAARDEGLLIIPAGDNVVRLLPPLNIDETHLREAIEKLSAAAAKCESGKASVAA